jgi:hypothetical protein
MSYDIASERDPTARFFGYARERHHTYLRRAAGGPPPWTEDEILRRYRFTNVFRELDRTTVWFRQHVRDPLRDRPEVLLATVAFRMLNRVTSGEAIFSQQIWDVPTRQRRETLFGEPHPTAFDLYVWTGDVRHLRRALVAYCGRRGPYVTGAYIISTPPGYAKLDGALWIIDNFRRQALEAADPDWRGMTLRAAHRWLRQFDYLGTFHSYEIVTDLRHTALLERASDVDTWANLGPGARRGLNRIAERRQGGKARKGWGHKFASEDEYLSEMRALLALSRRAEYWPQRKVRGAHTDWRDWPRWELRDVEHTLCEWDKWERVRTGEGTPRGRFP